MAGCLLLAQSVTGVIASNASAGSASIVTHGVAGRVFKGRGSFPSPSGKCAARLESGLGDQAVLFVVGRTDSLVGDITGAAWVSGDCLVFTSSPVYGRPGVYAYTCGQREPRFV